MEVLIRQARKVDCRTLIKIWKSAGFFYAPWDNEAQLVKKMDLQPSLILVAETNAQVIGGVIGTYDGWGAYINHLAVDSEFKAKGVDILLLRHIERRLKTLGVTKVFVFTMPGHEENVLYSKSGYSEWGLSMGLEKDI